MPHGTQQNYAAPLPCTPPMVSSPQQIRQEITEKLIAAIEAGALPWRRPWSVSPNAGNPANIISRRPYSGINPLLLELHRMEHGLQSKWFGTFEQIKALGGMVKKRPEHVEPGHWGCRIVFYRPIAKTVIDRETNEEHEEQFRVLRTYVVFNVDQCDGVALDRFRVVDATSDGEIVPDFVLAEDLVQATKADIRFGGHRAFYHRPTPDGAWQNHTGGDFIQSPHRNAFTSSGTYYETVFHELAHWSEVRLNWDRNGNGYAMGELIAEMAACYLATELGIPGGEGIDNHASYLRCWLEAMRGDSGFIFKASTQASRVTDFLLSFRAPRLSSIEGEAAIGDDVRRMQEQPAPGANDERVPIN